MLLSRFTCFPSVHVPSEHASHVLLLFEYAVPSHWNVIPQSRGSRFHNGHGKDVLKLGVALLCAISEGWVVVWCDASSACVQWHTVEVWTRSTHCVLKLSDNLLECPLVPILCLWDKCRLWWMNSHSLQKTVSYLHIKIVNLIKTRRNLTISWRQISLSAKRR